MGTPQPTCSLLYRWVRHLITCISKYQTPGQAASAREEGESQQRGRTGPDITEFLPFPGWVLEFESPGPLPGLPKATLWFFDSPL